ncbi:MAG: hypothetical protein LKE64_01085 [Solobacterium sp.]|jgi:hypothetical protein|nr:hypothetical protein [Solobacterium sp.]MCH4049967.1 hypothetical protein [Solobacterium sp.]MCH4073652.1 hypothetical protein [Solobacterium sp.]MCI1313141.1 hypothetical protein [Solobacterium sp.]MCI1346749.1 hypothetical protein [Solobacterium sp.]
MEEKKIMIYLWLVSQNQWYRILVFEHTDFQKIKTAFSGVLGKDVTGMDVFSYPDETAVYENRPLKAAGIREGMSFLLL